MQNYKNFSACRQYLTQRPKGRARLALLNMLLLLVFSSVAVLHASENEMEARLKKHVQYLASDELEGRGSGTEGNRKAAEYIANFFKEHGIKPLGASYFQEFPVVTDIQLGEKNSAQFNVLITPPGMDKSQGRNVKTTWKVGEEYSPLGFSQDTTITAGMAFAGYGISLKDSTYDDYTGIDVKGKVVIVLLGTPQRNNPRIKLKDQVEDAHSKFSGTSSMRYKATNARNHGAVGVLFVSPQGDSANILMPLSSERMSKNSGIIAMHVKRTAITKLLPFEPSVFKNEEKILATQKPHSFVVENVTATLTVSLKNVEKPTANVIGVVAGTNPAFAKEFLVVGAHFDHLGWGGDNSLFGGRAIHHGADDNASGTAGMMELAAIIAKNPLPRPVIFMGYTGEEMGLLGSAHYCKNPLEPLENTAFMLNMDMIGRMEDNKLQIQGTGSSPLWDKLVDSLGTLYNLKIAKTADGVGPSDHSSFYTRNIPVLFLFTALHKDYHRPTDTWKKINYKGQAVVVQLAESALRTIGNYAQRPAFTKVKTSEDKEKKTTGFRVYLGTIPDYSDHPKGLRLQGVREGSPAEKAGLQEGDVIIKLGTKDIKNAYDYTYALSDFNPGDRVKIVVLRGAKEDKEVTLEIVMGSR